MLATVLVMVPGMADDLDDLTREFWRIVQRLRRMPLRPPIRRPAHESAPAGGSVAD